MTAGNGAPVPELTRPRRLVPGDRVAVVAPSGPVPKDRLAAGLDVLRGWGLDPVVAPHVLGGVSPIFAGPRRLARPLAARPNPPSTSSTRAIRPHAESTHHAPRPDPQRSEKRPLAAHSRLDYLAATDRQRADDLQQAWCDPSVAAVVCARGGYGAQRMVDLLEWDALRAAGPKVLVGYSDITSLHEAFALHLGLATLHGPMAAAGDFLDAARARDHLKATLFDPDSTRTITGLPGVAPLVPGRASGVTLGGCLSLLAADLATPTGRPSARGGLLCLEDIGEEPYRLDRMLTQLLRSGRLDGVAGVLLGSWEECGPYDEVRAMFADRLGPLGVPVVERFGFGHCAGALTVPLGVRAELDADAGELRLFEPALA